MARYLIHINQDEFAESPRRAFDNLGRIATALKNYTFEDDLPHGYINIGAAFNAYLDDLGLGRGDVIAVRIYANIHGGITVMTEPHGDEFDSGTVGFIYVTREKVRQEYGVKRIGAKTKEKVIKVLCDEVKTLDYYLRGDVYRYEIEDTKTGETVDECGGYYGCEDYARGEAEAAVTLLERSDAKEAARVDIDTAYMTAGE